jgi:hypothetical protein
MGMYYRRKHTINTLPLKAGLDGGSLFTLITNQRTRFYVAQEAIRNRIH